MDISNSYQINNNPQQPKRNGKSSRGGATMYVLNLTKLRLFWLGIFLFIIVCLSFIFGFLTGQKNMINHTIAAGKKPGDSRDSLASLTDDNTSGLNHTQSKKSLTDDHIVNYNLSGYKQQTTKKQNTPAAADTPSDKKTALAKTKDSHTTQKPAAKPDPAKKETVKTAKTTPPPKPKKAVAKKKPVRKKTVQKKKQKKTYYTIQVAALKNSGRAKKLRHRLRSKKYPAIITRARSFWKVRVGKYDDPQKAHTILRKLIKARFTDAIVVKRTVYM